ncbi:MAG TPA: MarR family transcriptional regulator [Azospirillum sp.]|nr:MarR family transcriptional regulator [Azospirillum sp.]
MSTPKTTSSKYLPGSDSFDVNSFPLYWVARLNAKYGMEMEKKLKAVNMDVSRWRVAMLLRVHEELSISQIAEHAIAKLPTITKIVYRMQDEGIVTVKPSATDGRVSIVSLTEKGHSNIREVNETTQKLFKRLFNGISETQIQRLNATLQQMLNNLMED